MESKHCSGCDKSLPLDDFYFRRSKGRPNGRYCHQCKVCTRAANLAWKLNNPEKVRAQKKRHRDSHIDRYREIARECAARHAIQNAARAAEWRENNRDRYNAKSRATLARRRDRLANAYVADKLGLPVSVARPLIEAKRAQLILYRELKGTNRDND